MVASRPVLVDRVAPDLAAADLEAVAQEAEGEVAVVLEAAAVVEAVVDEEEAVVAVAVGTIGVDLTTGSSPVSATSVVSNQLIPDLSSLTASRILI